MKETYKYLLVVLGIIVCTFPILYELFLSFTDSKKHQRHIRQLNSEYDKTHKKRTRRLCTQCSYCRWRYYHPFSRRGKYYWVAVSKEPLYCKKFKCSLPHNSLLRCVSKLNSTAIYEDE